ncbi:recombinase family protein [Nocardia sp. NPDC052001]|uniref:recombinase family protein n=1 Tax=Nocardia sp. NPDC052001 TaxID=3154853 RepID=UPI0034354915
MTGREVGRRPIGRPRVASDELVDLIDRMNNAGQSFETIAQWLTKAGVPTPGGRPRWHSKCVWNVVNTVSAKKYLANSRCS